MSCISPFRFAVYIRDIRHPEQKVEAVEECQAVAAIRSSSAITITLSKKMIDRFTPDRPVRQASLHT